MFKTVHRFTPPTCTLEIKGKKSPLSRWRDRDVLKKIRFQLSFDDPRLPSSQQVVVKGDRQDLEKLKTVIDSYIQNFLHASFQAKNQFQSDLNHNQRGDRDWPYLQPQGLVSHELFFGCLKHDSTSNKIKLSTVQLFDLVTALEAYNTQISALPQLKPQSTKPIIFLWGGIAATLVAAVGTTAIFVRTTSVQNLVSSSPSDSSTDNAQLDEVIPPPAPKTPSQATPKPNRTLSSTKRLPPPPAVDTPKPQPDIPDPADYPLSRVARQSGLDRPSTEKQKSANRQTESVITIPAETKPETKPGDRDRNLDKVETIPEVTTKINPTRDLEVAKSNNSALESAKTSYLPQEPQLAEIKAYFQETWQPPAELKQSLEYRLYLDADGSVARVVPMGKAARLYLSQTKIPLQKEAFISPAAKSQPAVIRLLLNPDGGVRVFREHSPQSESK
ncbi:MAG: DUF4335 domain-containing protein [Pleurocapsa sp. MO_226.B13]|nr:DUF4335 domain-containing protein [Pleurocapsa sp. MO_226.B13]